MISVVIPLYNKEKQIEATLQSVLNQTFKIFEIVIVDDGSTDESVEAALRIEDTRIRLIRQTNQGVSVARNCGIREAKYEWIAFLDADDEWKTEYLQTQYDLSQAYPHCDVCACNYEFVDADGVVRPSIIKKLPFDGLDGVLSNYFEVAVSSHPPLCSSAVMVRKIAMQTVGGFPSGVKSGEDLLSWARLAVLASIAYTRKSLAVFNVEGYHISSKPKRVPQIPDVVGCELEKLWKQNSHVLGLKNYCGLWHKMRASVYMGLNKRFFCLRECLLALLYNSLNMKIFAYVLMSMIPLKLRMKIIHIMSK